MNSSATTTPTPTPTPTRTRLYEKSAEFARLYYFFEKLTQPRSREGIQDQESTSIRETTTADGPFPEDIAPLLKNLSAILTKDEPEDGDALGVDEAQVSIPETPMTALASTFASPSPPPPPPPSPSSPTPPASADHASTRPRRNTVAGSWAQTQTQMQTGPCLRNSVGQIVVRQTRFPLRVKRYPFTFKLLLHKLYDLEDWAAKVQEVLAASQEQFRSLSSTSANGSGGGDNSGDGNSDGARLPSSPRVVTFTSSVFGTASSPPESPPPARKRRAQSISKTKANDIIIATPRPPPPSQSSRAVKKRIVNRRRSTTGLGIGKMGDWMYDAAVSSIDAENVDARGHDSLRRRKRVLSTVGFAEEERRCVGRDVTNASF